MEDYNIIVKQARNKHWYWAVQEKTTGDYVSWSDFIYEHSSVAYIKATRYLEKLKAGDKVKRGYIKPDTDFA